VARRTTPRNCSPLLLSFSKRITSASPSTLRIKKPRSFLLHTSNKSKQLAREGQIQHERVTEERERSYGTVFPSPPSSLSQQRKPTQFKRFDRLDPNTLTPGQVTLSPSTWTKEQTKILIEYRSKEGRKLGFVRGPLGMRHWAVVNEEGEEEKVKKKHHTLKQKTNEQQGRASAGSATLFSFFFHLEVRLSFLFPFLFGIRVFIRWK